MIEVVIADHQELFRAGLVEVLSVADDVRIVGQAPSPLELLTTLQDAEPDVLILSTGFLRAVSRIRRIVKRRKIALLLLAEKNDESAYLQWLPAHGILYRSMDESAFLDAVRRVARGELFVQNRGSDMSDDAPGVA